WRSKELVAGLHVSDGSSVQDIGDESQELIAKSMERHHVPILAREAGTVYNIRIPFQNGLKQLQVILGIILQIRVLHDRKITSCVLETGSQCRSLTHVSLMV